MDLQNISLHPVMVLLGAEAFRRLERRQAWLAKALSPEMQELNFHAFQGGEDGVGAVLQACRDFPCFAERRVVLLKDAHKTKKKDSALLKGYLAAPVDTTVLILEADKLDGRLDWVKALKKSAFIFEVEPFSAPEAVAWVKGRWREQSVEVEEGVSERLVELLGADLGLLTQAITQLSLFVEEGQALSLAHLDELFVKVSEENIFEVLEALFVGNLPELYRGLERLLKTGEAPLRILALVYRHLSILLALRFAGEAGTWQNFRMPPMARQRYLNQVQRFGARLSYSVLKPLSAMDRKLKSSPLAGERVLKEGIREIAVLLS